MIESPALVFLLGRGNTSNKKWSENTPFEQKQNDTADILLVNDGVFNILDVKTSNKAKPAQPPNIISAYKLALMCSHMLDAGKYDTHDLTYIGIVWERNEDELVCTEVSLKQLFKTLPEKLYINWAAALQIQFHVHNLEQSFGGSIEAWCRSYLTNFVAQAKARSQKMIDKFVTPFEKYLE